MTSVDDDDLYFTTEMLAKIDHSVQQAKEGKVIPIITDEELANFLNAL